MPVTPVALIDVAGLLVVGTTMPPWPGDKEATVIEGPWKPNAPEG